MNEVKMFYRMDKYEFSQYEVFLVTQRYSLIKIWKSEDLPILR
jgi:hypothetical protein